MRWHIYKTMCYDPTRRSGGHENILLTERTPRTRSTPRSQRLLCVRLAARPLDTTWYNRDPKPTPVIDNIIIIIIFIVSYIICCFNLIAFGVSVAWFGGANERTSIIWKLRPGVIIVLTSARVGCSASSGKGQRSNRRVRHRAQRAQCDEVCDVALVACHIGAMNAAFRASTQRVIWLRSIHFSWKRISLSVWPTCGRINCVACVE